MMNADHVASYRLQDIAQAREHRDRLKAEGKAAFLTRSEGPYWHDGRILVWITKAKSDPRDPRSDEKLAGRPAIFRDHNCWKCRDGTGPCPNGYYNCEYPHARND